MRPATHLGISQELCGEVVELRQRRAEVRLETSAAMAVDEQGLVHGGFIFGCADYAAMLAVNDPWVVLAKAESRFLAPVRTGDEVVARAESDGDPRRPRVEVEVVRDDQVVASFVFGCAVLDHHVLEAAS